MTQPATERKSRKPENTAFKQQRLNSWQPILTPRSVLPSLFILGAIFGPLGVLVLIATNNVSEISLDYTDCYRYVEYTPLEENFVQMSFPVSDSSIKRPSYKVTTIKNDKHPNKLADLKCSLKFSIPMVLEPPIYLYYELSNFYQNHRSYVKSVYWPQLSGVKELSEDALKSCTPLVGKTIDGVFKPYYPCGLIANSYFNDTISDLYFPDTQTIVVDFSDKEISLKADSELYKKSPYNFDEILPPPFWEDHYPNKQYTEDFPPPDLSENQHFHVWMRIAALPTFRKLYGINKKTKMMVGTYEVQIAMNYNISQFGGRKKLIITTKGAFGGKTPFLGYVIITLSSVFVFFGILFTVGHFYKPRKLGDHTYLSWNQKPGKKEHL